MAFVLSRSVNELVARTLGLEIEPRRWDPGFIGAVPQVADTSELATAIEAVGKQGELSYLRRTLGKDEFVRLVSGGAVPIVLLPERQGSELEAAVVVKASGSGSLTIVSITLLRGGGSEYTATPDEVWTRLASRSLYALIPVRLTPILSDRGDGLIHDEPHIHLTPFQRLRQLLHSERRDIELIYLYAVLVGLFGLTVPLAVQGITQLVQGGLVLQPVVLLIIFAVLGTLVTGRHRAAAGVGGRDNPAADFRASRVRVHLSRSTRTVRGRPVSQSAAADEPILRDGADPEGALEAAARHPDGHIAGVVRRRDCSRSTIRASSYSHWS